MTRSGILRWLFAAALAVLLLAPLPIGTLARRWPALIQESKDLAHPFIFCWLAYLALRPLRARWAQPLAPYAWVLAGALFLALATETAQRLTGRDSSWTDVRNDMLGALFAVLLHAHATQPQVGKRVALAIVAGATALLAVAPFAFTACAYVYRAQQVPLLWQSQSALLGRFSTWQQGEYPGLVVNEPFPDWGGWQFLDVYVAVLQPESLRVVVRVHDRQHDHQYRDRYNETFTLPGHDRATLRIPLDRIRTAPHSRTLNMSAIRGLIVFAEGGEPGGFTVTEIRLAGRGASK